MSQLTDILRSEKFREFIRFAIVGVLATAIHYGLYLLLVRLFRLSETDTLYTNIAYSVGYLVAWCCNFWLSAHFTFRSNTSVKRGIGFAISHGINYLLHLLFLNLFLWMGLSEAVAPIPVFCIVIPINFLLVRYVFTSKHFR
jgi:putative flippase GtrA